MSKKMIYALGKREQITKANTNNSTSKMLWSFSKAKRFIVEKTECPQISYLHGFVIPSKTSIFGRSKRNIFTEVSVNPTSWNYDPKMTQKNNLSSSFGQARQKCKSNSYLKQQNPNNPGPGTYANDEEKPVRGYSMRPKTAYQRTYFLDNKQQKQVPSPFKYDVRSQRNGRSINSKFKTVCLGPYGPKYRNQRFKTLLQNYPAPNRYHPNKSGVKQYSIGGKIGSEQRKSFVDKLSHKTQGPGPGNYKVPSEFGHYQAKVRSEYSLT